MRQIHVAAVLASYVPVGVIVALAALVVYLAGGQWYRPALVKLAGPLLLALALFHLAVLARKKRAIRSFGDPAMVARLCRDASSWPGILKLQLFHLSIVFLLLAAAGPEWGDRQIIVKGQGIDLIVAVDTSRSMLAEDIRPNRLAAATREVVDILGQLKGDRIGVVAFAGKAFLQCPLTLDYGAARLTLESLDPESIELPGTSIGDAIRTAIRAFNPRSRFAGETGRAVIDGRPVIDVEDNRTRALVLITDGEDHQGETLDAAREAAEQGILIYTLGIGTGEGVPIPLRNEKGEREGFKKDRQGKVILTRLDEDLLREVGDMTGGAYFKAFSGHNVVGRLMEDAKQRQSKAVQEQQRKEREERYQPFLLIALFCILAEAVIPERVGRLRAAAAGLRSLLRKGARGNRKEDMA